jgi:hypothetical protein
MYYGRLAVRPIRTSRDRRFFGTALVGFTLLLRGNSIAQ